MNKTYLDSEMATPSAVGTMDVITPRTGPVTDRISGRDQEVESAQTANQEISQRKVVSAERQARPWYQRLLEIAAHNPPHPL
jgi:hypothetical protein